MFTQAYTPERSTIVRRGLRLEYLTLLWNSIEALVSVIAGLFAGSIALVGFGFDSVIECTSGAILIWRLRSDVDPHRRERVENQSRTIVGICFLLLAVYVAHGAITTVVYRRNPEHSVPGILIAIASVVVMPLLARAKRKVAQGLSSRAMHADSRQTDLCAYLSAILLGGLLLNAVLGWWWADPAAALAMVPIIAIEGVKALRHEACGCEPVLDNGCTDCHESGPK